MWSAKGPLIYVFCTHCVIWSFHCEPKLAKFFSALFKSSIQLRNSRSKWLVNGSVIRFYVKHQMTRRLECNQFEDTVDIADKRWYYTMEYLIASWIFGNKTTNFGTELYYALQNSDLHHSTKLNLKILGFRYPYTTNVSTINFCDVIDFKTKTNKQTDKQNKNLKNR